MKTSRENCLESNCSKVIKSDINKLLIPPFEGGTNDTQRLFSFFLHRAPNIKSGHSGKIPQDKHAVIFNQMMEQRHFKYQKFCSAQAHIENELSKGFLDGDTLCLKCKRYVCKKKQISKKGDLQETDMDCFLRHLRNSIAHGWVYYNNAGNKVHIIFEDKNDSQKLSARIVCVKADLEHWKKVLSKTW